MPVVDDTAMPRAVLPGVTPSTDYTPDFWDETVPAAFRIDNTIGSVFSNRAPDLGGVKVPDFDPFEHLRPGDEEYADKFAFADNVGDIAKIQNQIDREQKDREILASSGGLGVVASLSAGVLDPINLIPVGGTAYRTFRTGKRILDAAASVGFASAVGATAAEAALQHTQMTRSYGESATNVAASTVFGAVLGAGGSAVMSSLAKQGGKRIDDAINQIDRDLTVDSPGGSVGAARVRDLDPESVAKIEDEIKRLVSEGKIDEGTEAVELTKRIAAELLNREGVQKNWAVSAALSVVGKQDPTIRLLQSPSIEARALGQELFETTLNLAKNEVGDATAFSVEAAIRGHDAALVRGIRQSDDAYVQYMKGRSKRFGDVAKIAAARALGRGTEKLSYTQFREFVGKAMRRGDDANNIPGIPQDAVDHINKTAQFYRREVFEPLKDRAIKLGLLDEDVDVNTAVSYMTRVYNMEKLRSKAGRDQFIGTTKEWLARRQLDADARTKQFEADKLKLEVEIADLRAKLVGKGSNKKISEKIKELENRQKLQARDLDESQMSEGELQSLAEEIINRIEGTSVGRLPYDRNPEKVKKGSPKSGHAGPLKKRVFLIEDELIEEFLESDIEVLAKLYTRSVAADVEMVDKFGDLEMTSQFKKIQDEYDNKMREPDADVDKLTKQRDRDLKDLDVIRKRLLNEHGVPEDPMFWGNRAGRVLRQLNYVRLLGGMTLSAIPDLARVTMVHGLKATLDDVLVPLFTQFSQYKQLGDQFIDLGLASDVINNSRMQALADVQDDFARNTKLERGLGAVSDTFGMVSLMAPWNTVLKQMAGTATMNRMVRAIDAEIAGKINKKERTYLRAMSIDAAMGRKIRKQLDEHGSQDGKLTLPNALEWTDNDAFRVFQGAMNREINRIIVTPGMDKPILADSTEIGRHIFQFKSFAIAATQRIMLAGLQQRDAAALQGLVMSVALGAVASAAKMVDSGRGEELADWSTEKWLVEGFDRSGVTGWMFEAQNTIEKATRGTVGLSALTGGDQASRYASRNTAGALLGPSFGTVSTLQGVIGNAAAAGFGDDSWRASDTHALRRLLPYQNLMGWRRLLDQFQSSVDDALGVVE